MSKKIPEDFEIEDLDLENEEPKEEETILLSDDETDSESEELYEEEPKRKWNPHLILIIIIVFIFGAAAFKLYDWNLGEQIIIDPNEDTSEFDVETEDFIMQLDGKYLEGRKDDGQTTVLCLGNEAFASERGGDGITEQLATLTDSTVYNCAFNNTTLSAKNTIYDEAYPNDAFSLYWVTKSLTLQDFTLLDNTLSDFQTEDKGAKKSLDTLKDIDMDKVDIITIMYDGTDYLEDRIITSPYDLTDIGTCSGSLKQSLTLLRETYPYIRIIVMSPTFACLVDENGNYLPGSSTAQRNGFLSDYMIAAKNISVDAGVTFIDNYYGTVNEDNYKTYLEDHIILNQAGRKLVAERLAQIIK